MTDLTPPTVDFLSDIHRNRIFAFFQDVDVDPAPDEKSVMTYVAQFLHRYPEGAEGKVGPDADCLNLGSPRCP